MEVAAAAAALSRTPSTMAMMINCQSGNRCIGDSQISLKPGGGFRDVGHVLFYQTPTTRRRKEKELTKLLTVSCGLETEKKMKKETKKKIKLLKGLTKDLSMLSENRFIGELSSGEGISEAAETLMKHLQEMKSKEKEMKKKRKTEKEMKAAAAAARKAAGCESTSSSSESSDSECGEVVDFASLRRKSSSAQCELSMSHPEVEADSTLVLPCASLHLQESILRQGSSILDSRNEVAVTGSSNVCSSVVLGAETLTKKIEVCMGGKCKKSGAAQLVEEFEKVVGEGAEIVGCKCMGKCRDGPNVRVLSSSADTLSPPPMCIGVGLEDVGVIVANFVAGDGTGGHLSLAAAAVAT